MRVRSGVLDAIRLGPIVLLAFVTAGCGPTGSSPRPSPPIRAAEPAPSPEPRPPGDAPADSATTQLRPALEASDDAAAAVTVRFDWVLPCRVPVVQDGRKRGRQSRITYDLVARAGGPELVVALEDVRFVSFDGVPARESALAGQLDQLERQIAAAMPTFRVDSGGAYLGLSDVDAAIELTIQLLEGQLDDDEKAKVEAMMRAPETRAMIEQKSGDHWNAWVGAWLGRELTPGQPLEVPLSTSVPGAAPIEVVTVIRHHGRVAGHPEAVLLSATTVIDGDQAIAMVLQPLRNMAAQMGQPPPPDDAFESVRRETVVTVAIEPDTGRPLRSRSEMTIDIDGTREIELRDLAFDWAAGEGCAR